MTEILKIAITGGIASGKSVVMDALDEFENGVRLDSDRLARRTYEPGGPAYEEIVDLLGKSVLREDKRVDRSKLADEIYEDAELRDKVESLIHPLVAEAFLEAAKEAKEEGKEYIALEVPLLFQSDYVDSEIFDTVILVEAGREKQLERVRQRDGLSRDFAEKIMTAQNFSEELKKKADHVISTDGSLSDTERKAKDLFERLLDPS